MTKAQRLERLIAAIPNLSDYQMQLIERAVNVFSLPKTYLRLPSSKLVSDYTLDNFGDVLRLHHCLSREPFSKDKFEYALEKVMKSEGINADLAPRGQRGYDITIRGENISLKTQAASGIRIDTIHISKYMELGGGQWGDNPEDLVGLRNQFLTALGRVARILILRALRQGSPDYFYELVEIPVELLKKASQGILEMKSSSPQSPKPGYCYVKDGNTKLFNLYFDGGGERKLQIKDINKAHCIVHATWAFALPTEPLLATP